MLHLRTKSATSIPVEADEVSPDKLAGKSIREIETLPLQHGNRRVPLAEFFDVSGAPDSEDIVIDGDCRHVKWLGARMNRGRLTIHGGAGAHLGAEMTGGAIHLHGDADDGLGKAMRGGLIRVRGDVGARAGGVEAGARAGMRGGVILIEGSAGADVGANMRRGLIAIGKNCGEFAGAGLIAGSIFVFGAAGPRLGAGIKRGTVAVFGELPPLLPTFRFDCTYRPAFVEIYLRRLNAWTFPVPDAVRHGSFRRYSGDLLSLGKGELLHWQPT